MSGFHRNSHGRLECGEASFFVLVFFAKIEHFNNRLSLVPEMKAFVYIMDVSEELL